MNGEEQQGFLAEGRELLEKAAEIYERTLSPEDYWFLGAGLAACTLAELEEKSYAVGRIEQLMDRLGHKGIQGDWFQRFVEELATLNAEGLLWPVYERSPEGPMEPTGLAVAPSFTARAGYYLALAHLGVALALNREDSGRVNELAGVIADLVEQGLKPEHETAILGGLEPPNEADDEE
ncbi:MAG: hypothetical protein ACOY94_00260 [Bacillota bacterium]